MIKMNGCGKMIMINCTECRNIVWNYFKNNNF